MKKFISLSLAALLLLSGLSPLSFADEDVDEPLMFDCGRWEDVPDESMDILEEVCEYGLMQGLNYQEFGFGEALNRAEVAVIGNRLIYASDIYDFSVIELEDNHYFEGLEDLYNDVPNNEEAYEWVHKAMFLASDIEVNVEEEYPPNGIMTGDDGDGLTSFRPFDGVNIVEALKVLYGASYESEILNNMAVMSYDEDPWYFEMVEQFEIEEGITTVDFDEQSVYLGDPVDLSYAPFSLELNREDLAYFLFMMIESGMIDNDKIDDHVFGGYIKPDLYVGEISIYDENPTLEDEVVFTGVIVNGGPEESGQFYMDFLFDDESYGSRLMGSIGPYEELEFEYSMDASVLGEGQFEFTPVPDFDDELDEQSDHNNDDNSLSFVVGGLADLEIMQVDTFPESPEAGEAFEIHVIVANLGLGAALETNVLVYNNEENNRGRYFTLPALFASEETTVVVEIEDGFSAGTYANDVILDPSNKVIERDEETDHEVVMEFTVQ